MPPRRARWGRPRWSPTGRSWSPWSRPSARTVGWPWSPRTTAIRPPRRWSGSASLPGTPRPTSRSSTTRSAPGGCRWTTCGSCSVRCWPIRAWRRTPTTPRRCPCCLLGLGLELRGLGADVELLSYLLNASRREHALADLARERLHLELPVPYDAAAARRAGSGLADRPPEEVAEAFGQRGAGGGTARPGPVAGHRVGPADRARPRAGAAARPGADPDGAPRHQGGPGRARRAVARRGRAVPQLRGAAALAGRQGVQRQQQRPAGAGALHGPRAPGPQEGEDRTVHRRRGAGEARREAPASPRAARVPDAQQAEVHVPRRARPAGRRGRAPPHHLPPGGHRDRPAVQLRSEPPEHPGAHRGGPGHPPGLRGRARVEAGLGGLQPDRAAHPGARLRGPGAALARSRRERTCTSAPRPRCSG